MQLIAAVSGIARASPGGKLVLADAAQRANEIFGQGIKLRAGSDAVVRIAQSFFVNVTANVANILFHNCNLLYVFV